MPSLDMLPSQDDILTAIEEIVGSDFAFDAECDLHMRPETMTDKEITYAKMLGDVYLLAHGYNRSNICYGSHEDWRKL